MSEETSRASCPVDDARAERATLRGAGVLEWDAFLVHTATEQSGPGLVHNECIAVGDIVVAEYPVASVETARSVCRPCNEPI